jgi:hypothetical protein
MEKKFLFYVVLLSAAYSASAERVLEKAEILQILRQLTSQPQKTWIQAGTITATHQEYKAPKITDSNEINRQIKEAINTYQQNTNKPERTEDMQLMQLDAIPFNLRHKLSNEYTMTSSVVVKVNGEKFIWEINADSRSDSIKPGKNLSSNYMTKQFDLNWNQKRIFAWDGETYTTYFLPGNQAILDSTGTTPHSVNGPLTAGKIPWGLGKYSYDKLATYEVTAIEKTTDGQTQMELTLYTGDSKLVFMLDPQKNYAVISCLIYKDGSMIASRQYSDFQQIANTWIPYTILLEQYEGTTNRLISRDFWDIKSIDTNVPSNYEFEIKYNDDALIEHAVTTKAKPEIYHYNPNTNVNLLLADRLEFELGTEGQTQNCATAALKYALAKLGKNIDGQQLSTLVDSVNGQTSLYSMKQFAQSQGVYSMAVNTDIETLKSLNNCTAILYLPGKEHFVLLDSIDDKYVWLIDLSSKNFYYHVETSYFDMDWKGIALLISSSPISQGLDDLSSDTQNTIKGLGYECTKLLQSYTVYFCEYAGGVCDGTYVEYLTRYGCQSGTGSCSGSSMIRFIEYPCAQIIKDEIEDCLPTGDPISYYMRACL